MVRACKMSAVCQPCSLPGAAPLGASFPPSPLECPTDCPVWGSGWSVTNRWSLEFCPKPRADAWLDWDLNCGHCPAAQPVPRSPH